ncbi:MAG: uracil-DNA glycosylase [Nitrospinota bacterium]
MSNELLDIIEGLKKYLNYLKMIGIDEIPVSVHESKSLRVEELTPEMYNPSTPQIPAPLEAIREEIGDCRRCKLWSTRKNIVFGSGNPHAELIFVGEGPGEDEDIQGLPFVGRAGQKLTEIIEKGMGLKRKDVYICNVVKCRPPENREPETDEITACKPFLEKQIKVIKPKVIVALGKPATATLLNNKRITISKIRGIWQWYNLSESTPLLQRSDSSTTIKLMPTYHPAYLLRNYTPEVRKQIYEDMKKVIMELEKK